MVEFASVALARCAQGRAHDEEVLQTARGLGRTMCPCASRVPGPRSESVACAVNTSVACACHVRVSRAHVACNGGLTVLHAPGTLALRALTIN